MRIHSLHQKKNSDNVEVSVIFETCGKQQTLWFSVDSKYADWVTMERYDAFVVGLLPLAMANGEDIEICGAISERLYYNLSNYFIYIYNSSLPAFKKVKILPESTTVAVATSATNIVGTSFSGGIDSFNTIIDHTSEKTPASHRLTHLFFYNAGGNHGKGKEAQAIFNNRLSLLTGFSHDVGLDYISVDSNLGDIYNFRFVFLHEICHIACTLLLQNRIKTYYYAAAFELSNHKFGPVDDFTYADPYAIHLLSTETIDFILSGAQYTRVEKSMQISKYEPSYRYLNVCFMPTQDGKNCSKCEKCCRALLTFEILGCLDRYKQVFNIDIFQSRKSWYINLLFQNSDKIFSKEIIHLAQQHNYQFPTTIKNTAILKRTVKKFFKI